MSKSCPQGWTETDLRRRLGDDGYAALTHWLRGQTMGVCDGRAYDYESGNYLPTACASHPHGPVVYSSDVATFEAGRPPAD